MASRLAPSLDIVTGEKIRGALPTRRWLAEPLLRESRAGRPYCQITRLHRVADGGGGQIPEDPEREDRATARQKCIAAEEAKPLPFLLFTCSIHFIGHHCTVSRS